MLEVRSLEVDYGDVPAVQAADLAVADGKIVALLGPSGCGKTTLLRAVAGFERPGSGEIRLGGELVSGSGAWVEPEKRQVGMVFQDGALFPHLNVFDNVLYGIRGEDRAGERVAEVLRQVGLEELAERFPDQLSGGQQQRVALARALAPEPRIVLLDEPFANLDESLRERVRGEVRAVLQSAGMTAVLVTHDQEEALSFADEVAVMIDGEILQVGPPGEVYHRPTALEVARFLGNGEVVPVTVTAGRLESAFGEAECAAPDGPAQLFVRPEDLTLETAPDDPSVVGSGAAGRIVSRSFFGHDVLDRVDLADGGSIEVRSLSSETAPVGSAVRISLRERRYRVFSSAPRA